MTVLSLLADGALAVEFAAALRPALSRWLPLVPADTAADPAGARIRVVRAHGPASPPPGAPTLRLGRAQAWIAGELARLASPSGVGGTVDLARRDAELAHPDAGDADAAAWDLYSAATLACALLLGRMGRALVHAAAVAPPDGGALLLVGDTHAGKTTTTATLLRAGWGYLSDDHVVLSGDADDGVRVEGLPRPFHLDEGWDAGAPVRVRGEADPRARWPGRWRRSAPLAGVMLPRVEPDAATARTPVPAAEALAALLRQSPWLLADRAVAADVLALLGRAATRPAHGLRLGLDTYADPGRLAAVVAGG